MIFPTITDTGDAFVNIFKDIATLIKTEEGVKLLPLLATALNSVAATPTLINATAQGHLLMAGAISAEIGIGTDALKLLAADVTELSNEVTSAAPTVVATGSTAPAAPAA